jgi:hypothetical protein
MATQDNVSLQVTNEIARISNVAPGIFRKTLTDVQVKGNLQLRQIIVCSNLQSFSCSTSIDLLIKLVIGQTILPIMRRIHNSRRLVGDDQSHGCASEPRIVRRSSDL